MAEEITTRTIDECPKCDYSLRGLPDEYACPECGCRYDRNSRLWRSGIPRIRFWGLLVLQFGLVLFNARNPNVLFSRSIYITIILLITVLGVGIYFYRRKKGHIVALIPEGLLLRLDIQKPVVIPWKNISRIAPVHSQKGITVGHIQEKAFRDYFSPVFTQERIDEIVKVAEVYKR